MTLRQQGQHSYGDSQLDIRERLFVYSTKNGYPAEHFADASCGCGSHLFRLLLDDTEGAAVRICSACSTRHPMGDSEEYLEEANLEECECPCGSGSFEITVGVALYKEARAVRWIYVGARCPACGLTACYGDWKNEFDDYEQLLRRI
jgi:hypothetical protein